MYDDDIQHWGSWTCPAELAGTHLTDLEGTTILFCGFVFGFVFCFIFFKFLFTLLLPDNFCWVNRPDLKN